MNCRWEVWEVWEDMFITSTYSVTPIMCVPVAYIFHNFLWPDARLTRFSIQCPNNGATKDFLITKIM